MALHYEYAFAEIDNATNMCVGVLSTSNPEQGGPTLLGTTYVAIPEYSNEYLLKYYNFETEKFYHDAEMTQEFILS